VNTSLAFSVPAGATSCRSASRPAAPGGMSKLMRASLTFLNGSAVPSICSPVTPLKLLPSSVIEMPPEGGPKFGRSSPKVGGAAVGVCVGVEVRVGVDVCVGVGVTVRVGVGVRVGTEVRVGVGVCVCVGAGVLVGVRVGEGVAVGDPAGRLVRLLSRSVTMLPTVNVTG